MEPAKTIIAKLGGPSAVAEALGVHRTRVSNWMRPRSKGGTGGTIPHWRVANLISFAASRGIDLQPVEFAPVLDSEVAA